MIYCIKTKDIHCKEQMTCLGLERSMYMVKGKQEEFACIWESFMSFLTNGTDNTD